MYIIEMTTIFGKSYFSNTGEKNMDMLSTKKAYKIKKYDHAKAIVHELNRYWNERKGFATFKIITQGDN